jgi:ribonucleotide monophosphatase NagD (HAD superfamily)
MGMASLRHDPVIAPIAVEGVVIGDRRSTDGAFAQALGWPFIEVRSVSSESPSPVPVAVTVPSLLDAVAGVAG